MIVALFKLGAINYESDYSNNMAHNLRFVDIAINVVLGIDNRYSKDQLLSKHLAPERCCFNNVEIEKLWNLPNDKLNDNIKKILNGQLRYD